MKKENNNLNLNPPQINPPEGILPFLDYVPFGYLRISIDGLIMEINKVMLEWSGYSKEEVRGKLTMKDLLGENSIEQFDKDLKELKETGRLVESDLQLKKKKQNSNEQNTHTK